MVASKAAFLLAEVPVGIVLLFWEEEPIAVSDSCPAAPGTGLFLSRWDSTPLDGHAHGGTGLYGAEDAVKGSTHRVSV